MNGIKHPFIRLVLALLFCGAMSHAAIAQRDSLGTLPAQPAVAGFVVDVVMPGGGRLGYQPIDLGFRPRGAKFRRERRVTVFVRPAFQNGRLQTTFRQTVNVPEGTTGHRERLLVPRYHDWDSVEMWLQEDGATIETSERSFPTGALRRRGAQQQTTIGLIYASANLRKTPEPWERFPDIRTLVTVFGDGPLPEGLDAKRPRLTSAEALKLAMQTQPAWVQFRPIQELKLHDNWLAYSQLDAIIIAAPLLQRIANRSPEKIEGLQSWVAAGGNLWIYAAPLPDPAWLSHESFSKPLSNDISLGDPKFVLNLSEPNDTTELTFQYWQGVAKSSINYNAVQRAQLTQRQQVFDQLVAAGHPFAEEISVSQLQQSLRKASYGLGEIILIKDQDPFPGSFRLWQTVARWNGQSDLHWSNREGLDIQQGNNSYWSWLIPSVGQPPVTSFVILNTLFVIVVGPVSYFFFRRRGRLYLLYFFAPTFAILVTTCLFAYALLSDGIRTRVRARQVTWVDLNSGYQICQARQTYFKSFGSGSEIAVGRDVAVYPVSSRPLGTRYYYRRERNLQRGTITQTADHQRFGGDFFPVRDQVQYLMRVPERTSTGGSIQFRPRLGDEIALTNDTELSLSPLIFCDGSGRLWLADRADARETVTARRITKADVADLMRTRFSPAVKDAPQLAGNPRVWGNRAITVPTMSELETTVDQWIDDMPRNSFMGLAPIRQDLLGVDDVVMTDSLHVVMGELP